MLLSIISCALFQRDAGQNHDLLGLYTQSSCLIYPTLEQALYAIAWKSQSGKIAMFESVLPCILAIVIAWPAISGMPAYSPSGRTTLTQ
jgi:hypothetical protein